jgi:ABC-type amino acid transport substrate-binding protein
MKKVLSAMLVLVMALAVFTGCGSSDSGNSASGSDSGSDTTYIIATDTVFAPFEFTDAQNNFVGIDVDILAAVAEDQGFKYQLNSLGFDAAVAALESGQADGVIAGMSIKPEREEKYDFSTPYYDSTVCAAVKEGSTAATLDDIKGSTVAVKNGTMSSQWAEDIAEEYQLKLTYFDDSAMMYQDVITGNSVACFEDYPVMAYGVSQGNGLQILAEQGDDYATPYAFAVLKGQNAELLQMFNDGLANITANGTFDEIVAKYTEA